MKKGFTLIELVGVVVILGLLSAFSVTAFTKLFSDSADKQYTEYVKNITMAAENYFHNETDGLLIDEYKITIGELAEKGYLKKEINPKTNEEVQDTYYVRISKNEDGTEKYEFVERDINEEDNQGL